MSRRAFCQVGVLAASSLALAPQSVDKQPSSAQTAVFVAPHQDDETLAMGAAIQNHVAAGFAVHVLLLSNGVNSGARARVGLTRAEFTGARDDELHRASTALGIPTSRVHISRHSTEDGRVTVQAAEDSINWFLDQHPGAWVKAYSPHAAAGRHTDHVNSGVACANLNRQGRVTNLRFYVEPWLVDTFRRTHPAVRVNPERPRDVAVVHRAFDAYTQTGPARYGIGGISVASFFAQGRADTVNWVHVP